MSDNKSQESLTVQDIMRILKISRATAYKLIQSGELVSYKFGRLVRIPPSELDKFIDKNLRDPRCPKDKAEDLNSGKGKVR
jgi:excisionase family DNA binding protein